MKIMVAAAVTANSSWEERVFAEALCTEIKRQGHQTDFFFLPVVNELLSLPEQMVMFGMLDIENSADLLITIGYPAFALPHKNKVICLFSITPELNEAWDTEYGMLATPQYVSLKEALYQAELRCFEGQKIICASRLLAEDIKNRYGNSPSVISLPNLYPFSPANNDNTEQHYLICETDLQPISRIETILQSMKEANESTRLHLYIHGSKLVYREALEMRIDRLGISDRISVIDGFIDKTTMGKAAALISIPYQSRRIPLEVTAALAEGVPVITTSDSGCLLELVKNKVNGLVTEPISKSLAIAINSILSNKKMRRHFVNGSMDKIAAKIVRSI